MTTRFAIATGTLPTTVVDKNFTNAGLGSADPKALAWVMVNRPTALNTITAGVCHSISQCDDTADEDSNQCGMDDATTATSNNVRRTGGSNLYRQHSGSSYTDTEQSDLDSITDYITNGFTSKTNTATAALQLAAGMFNGDGLSVGQYNLTTATEAESSTFTNSGWAFEADVLLVISYPSTAAEHAHINIGIVTNEPGGIVQRCLSCAAADNTSPTEGVGRLETDRCAAFYDNTSSTYRAGFECTAFSSTGFTMTLRDGAANTDQIKVLGLKSTDWIFRLIDFDIPTSGDLSTQDAGVNLVTDGGILGVCSHLVGTDTEYTDTTTIGIAQWLFDGTTTRCMSSSYKDAVTTTVAKSRMGSDVGVLDPDGTLSFDMVVSAESTGFSGDLSTAAIYPPSITKNFALVFGPEATGGVILPAFHHLQHNTGSGL